MKKFLLVLLLIALFSVVYGQTETIKVMQYNLMYYGQNTSYCTTSNNNINAKNAAIRTILTEYYPDIFTVCEMGKSTSLPCPYSSKKLRLSSSILSDRDSTA